MPTIATLNTVLTASSSAFEKGIGAAKSTLGGFEAAIGSTQAKIVGMVGVLTGLAGAGGLGALIKSQAAAIDGTAKTADQLGIGTEALIGMRHAADLAGVGNEEFDASLRKMQKGIGEASVSGGSAAEKFEALGLSVNDLTNSSPDQQFAKISEAIRDIENPAQRAAAVTDIFGKAGQKLIPTILGGSDAMAAAAAETELFGNSLSRVEAAKVEAANDSLTRVGSVVKGIGAQLAIAVAPFVEAAAKKFIELSTAGGGIRATVGSAVEFVGSGLALVADVLETVKMGFQLGASLAVKALGFIVRGIGALVGGLTTVGNLVGMNIGTGVADAVNSASASLLNTAAGIDQQLAESWTGQSWGDKVKATFKGITAQADAAAKATVDAIPKPGLVDESAAAAERLAGDIGKVEEKLAEQVDTAGMSADQIERWKLAQKGATDEQLASIDALIAHKTAQDAQADAMKEGKKITEDQRTPLEKYEAELKKLDDLQKRGAIDAETNKRAQLKALEELDKASGKPQLASALEAGSQQALDAFASFQAGGGGGEDVAGETLDENRKQSALLSRIEKKFPQLTVGSIAA